MKDAAEAKLTILAILEEAAGDATLVAQLEEARDRRARVIRLGAGRTSPRRLFARSSRQQGCSRHVSGLPTPLAERWLVAAKNSQPLAQHFHSKVCPYVYPMKNRIGQECRKGFY